MNRPIYTYINLKDLGTAPFWEKIKHFPQITVTADLRKSLKGTVERDKIAGVFNADQSVRALEFRKLSDAIIPHWTDDETKFHETVVLSQYLRDQITKQHGDLETRRWLVGCRRNLHMILSSIVLLEEAEISPSDIQADGNRNIELLIDAWNYLRKNDSAINSFRARMQELKSRSAWNPIFTKLFGTSEINTLVFHGFYYFTPLQERIMRLLEKAGIQLIFLFAYDEKYPYANEIWRKTYSVENGYPPVSSWSMERTARKEPYGEIFEGRKAAISNKLKIKEYASVVEFVHEIKHAKEQGYFVYSANANAANEILRDFYPEEYGERKILSYPIGQFVSTLNRMWDEDLNDIVLSEDLLVECFASGWLASGGLSGKQYMQDLTRILPFFADCKRIREWEQRIELLKDIKENVIDVFMDELDVDEQIARWQAIMGNPFLNFSVFSVESEKLDVILQLIQQLLSMANDLFGKDQAIRISDHIRKLDNILLQHEMSNELYDEERELVKAIFEKLSDPSGFATECFPADISSALNLYMSGRFQEGEIQSNRIGMVSPIYQIDAAIVKQQSKVHICLCDVNNMPGGKKEYIWPLTGSHIIQCHQRTNNPLIANLRHIMDNTYICNRYFMYAALKNDDVQLSWIHDVGDKILAPSPYIRLITEAIGMKLTPSKRAAVTYQKVQGIDYGKGRTKTYNANQMPMITAKEAKMDYALCPMKYAMGYVVEKYPTFESEFHQNYAINGLIAAIYSLMKGRGMSIDEIYRNVMGLFPAMRKVEKRQIYDYLQYESSFTDVDFQGHSELGDISYTDERLKVRFPNKSVRDQALLKYGKLLTPDGETGMDFYKTAADKETTPYKKTSTDACLFCQHQNYCRYAVFAVDTEALYE